MPAPTRFTVSFRDPSKHFMHVDVQSPDHEAGEHCFFMPCWTPGSYLIREFARHVLGFCAKDSEQRELRVRKIAKNRWSVNLDRAGDIHLSYRVYCRDLTVRTNHVDEQRAYWNGAATYILSVDRVAAPIEIDVKSPEGWQANCALPQEGGVFLARDLDEAVDSPFLVGDCPRTSFEVIGVPHILVCDGLPDEDAERLTRELTLLVKAAADIFARDLPYKRYYYLLFVDGSGSGGLEHADSCVIHVRRSSFRKSGDRMRMLGLFAHEHFHAWNVKRIRPSTLVSFDYENENYCRELWLSEGFTSYYQEIIPYDAGLFDREFFLDRLAANAWEVLCTPGREQQSVSDSSFDAWIKLYRPDENSRNSTVSYYSKGALIAFSLDLLIQERSNGEKNLDHVMRGLYQHYLEHGKGQSRELIAELVNLAAGADLTAELVALVDGREDPDLGRLLEPFGLSFEEPDGSIHARLDMQSKVVDGFLRVSSVDRGGAGDMMGLTPDDEIVAINKERVAPADFDKFIREQCVAGSQVELTLFRRGMQRQLSGRLGGRPAGKARILERPEGRLRYRLHDRT